MTDQMKKILKEAIQCLSNGGAEKPVKILAPLVQNINHGQYSKLVGHINTCYDFRLKYINDSDGYNDGVLTAVFTFPTSKSKIYRFNFSSTLDGEYAKDEWWLPLVDISVTEDIGNTMGWNGSEKDFLKFEKELWKELNNEKEILKLKQEIAEKQRQLARLTA